MKLRILLSMFIFFFIFSGTAMALKCGNTFIKPGVSTLEVLHACGEPKFKETVGSGGKSGKIEERWGYGPHKGNYYFLYFKGGVLEKVDSKKK